MPFAKVNDIGLYYEIYGAGEPIVFIAGFSSDHFTWLPLVQEFSKHFQVFLFDNRGVGQSSAPNYQYTIDIMADDVYHLCQKLNLKNVNFVGSSMGGKIVQNLGYRYPQLCHKLVISNSFSAINPNFMLFAKAQLKLRLAKAPIQPLIELALAWVFSPGFLQKDNNLEQLIQLNLDNPYPITPEGYENQLAALGDYDSWPQLPEIKAPCLLLASEEDIIAPAKYIKSMLNVIPNAKYYYFNGAGHLPHFELPEEFSNVVLPFLREL
jgi:3-oxoadipate enol-lactonase